MTPQRLGVALFGMGCFMDSEARFGIVNGVWKTSVGYSGGRYAFPSHDDTGDHFETVMVKYDPLTVSYGQLLEFFLLWSCSAKITYPTKHALRIFVRNETERRLAQAAMERYSLCVAPSLHAEIVFFKVFYLAEKWCQKHFLRTVPWLMAELQTLYPSEDELIRSTLAARLNGYLGQSHPSLSLLDDVEFYDLSERVLSALERIHEQREL